jgi:hypothetical protein
MNRKMTVLFVPLAISIALIAQQAATEVPTGFDTPTLSDNPGSQSVSNGIVEPPGDTFALDQFQWVRLDWDQSITRRPAPIATRTW